MRRLLAWLKRLAGVLPKRGREQELNAELETYLEMHTEDNIRAGMKPVLARRQAVLALHGVEAAKQACRDQRSLPPVESLLQDLRFAIRQLRRNPGFTMTAMLMLSLGIAASVAMFAFVDAALLKPLPYSDPVHLLSVSERIPMFPRSNISVPDYLDWKKMNTVFSSLDVYNQRAYLYQDVAGSKVVPGTRVSDGFFRTLGVTPIVGRDFHEGEDLASSPNLVILSYDAWQQRFGGQRDVIGKNVNLSGDLFVVIGVLPGSFHFAPAGAVEFWTTLHPNGNCDKRRSCHGLFGVARLKEGISVAAAQAQMQTIAKQLEIQYPDSNRGQGATVQTLSSVILGDVRPILLVLLGGSCLLLLIACMNVASLLLVRSENRTREIALRGALGASFLRIVRQFATEGLLLNVIGTTAGLTIAYGAMHMLLRLLSKDMLARVPYLAGIGFTAHTSIFAVCVSLATAGVVCLTPMIRVWSGGASGHFSEGTRDSGGTSWKRFGAGLVVAEVAIATVLLAQAGLLGKSLYGLLHVRLGFNAEHLGVIQVALPSQKFAKDEQIVPITHEILSRVSALPGVEAVAASSRTPVAGNGNTTWVRIVGHPYTGEHNEVNSRDVSASYFKTVQATLLRGRMFSEDDDASKPLVVIVNKQFADLYFPGEDPVGKRYGDTSLSPKSIREVVGVIDNIREGGLDEKEWATEYDPINQSPDGYFTLLARTSQDEASLLPAITSTLHDISPDIATTGEVTMNSFIHDSAAAYLHRVTATVVGGFAALALVLSIVGLYGVVAYSVSRRTREIGVRMALGANRLNVYRLVLTEAGRSTVFGLSGGLVVAIGLATAMRNLLFAVRSWDIGTLTAVAVVLGLSAMVAGYVPARQAASVNPADALRAE